MIVPFSRVPIPVDGENAHGYFRRFAACCNKDNAKTFGRAIGMWNFGPTSETAKWEKLAAHAGLPVDNLLKMRRRNPDEGGIRNRVTLLGQPIKTTHVVVNKMRFCPLCLAAEPRPEQRILREFWSVYTAPACATHGTLLVDQCDVCHQDFEYRRNSESWGCGCGRRMTEVATFPAPLGSVEISAALAARFGCTLSSGAAKGIVPKHLLQCLGDLPANDLCSVLDRLSILAGTSPDQDSHARTDRVKPSRLVDQSRPIADYANQLHLVAEILSGWPDTLDGMFAEIRGRNPAFTSKHRVKRLFGTNVGLLLFWPVRSINEGRVDAIEGPFQDWLKREHAYRKGMRKAFPVNWRLRYAEDGIGQEPVTKEEELLALKVAEGAGKPPLLTTEEKQNRNLSRRVDRIRQNDLMLTREASSRLLRRLWPAFALNLDEDARVRKGWIAQRYKGVPLRRVGFHIADAIDILEELHGPAAIKTQSV